MINNFKDDLIADAVFKAMNEKDLIPKKPTVINFNEAGETAMSQMLLKKELKKKGLDSKEK